MNDLISRQDVLALAKDVTLQNGCKHRCIDATMIHELPPAEQVIRCKDCKYFEQYTDDGTFESVLKMHQWDGECSEWVGHTYMGWFCSRAERRTDETD